MKFSVIIPVYNVENYLAQCVESILKQDYDNFELILVDDGSSDMCPTLCDTYAAKDSRIIVIHKKNGGLSDARNVGIETANGDFVCFVDSDDFICDSAMLSKLAKILANTEAELVQYGHIKYYQLDDRYEQVTTRTLSVLNGKAPHNILNQLVTDDQLTISACSMTISRKYLLKYNLFFEKNLKSEDLEWTIRLLSHKPKMAFSDDYYYVYRMQRAGSITATIDYNHLCDYCYILEKSISVIEDGDEDIKKAMISYLMYHTLIASALCYRVNLNKTQRKELLRRIEAVSKERISENHMGKKVRVASVVYRFCGFPVTARVLGFYLKYRGR